MSWFHVDDKFHGHPKVATADEAGIGAWAKLGSWSSLHQTDGRIPGAAARKLCTRKGLGAATKAGLLILDTEADVYAISGYLRCNPSAETVAARRDKWAEKKRTARDVPRGLHGGQGDVSPGDSPSSEPGDSSRGRARSPAPAPVPSPDPDQRDPGSAGSALCADVPFEAIDFTFRASEPALPPRRRKAPATPAEPGPEDRLFEVYLEGWKAHSKGGHPPRLDAKRRSAARDALKTYPIEVLEAALRGIWLSDFHVAGRYTGFALALRDGDRIDRFAAIAANPETGKQNTNGNGGSNGARDAEARSSLQKAAPEGARRWEEGPRLFPTRTP